MWERRSASGVIFSAMLAAVWPARGSADEPAAPPAEASEGHATQLEIEPPQTRVPWSGKEAIWGGVGLIVAGVATLIVVAPALCTSSLFNGSTAGVGAVSTGPNPRTTCLDVTVGGGAGSVGLGVVLLVVGERQRATYREWLRTHPMFAGLSVRASSLGPELRYSFTF